jgi:O-acetyl-ADP-ribose deacetylase (regulator of RNase III)
MKTVKAFGKEAGSGSGTLRISLCDRNPDITDIWSEVFRDADCVEVVEGDLLELDCDALVSPANSFGDMSGGIDQAIDDFYGGRAQDAVMAAIRDRYLGELPVGVALIVALDGPRFPFLVAAPTMRVPTGVGQTINAYLSLRAALVAVFQHNWDSPRPIRSLAVPGLCTGVGGMDFGIAARQMRSAFDNVIGGGWKDVVHPAQAPYALGSTAGMGWSWNRSGESETGKTL